MAFFFFLLQREGGGDGVSGGGGRRRRWGERKARRVSVCVRAPGCSRWSLLSQRVALRPSPVAVCEGGREPGSLSSLSRSPLSLSPCPPFSLCLCVCACACVVAGGGERAEEAGAGAGALGAEVRRRGDADTPDDWLQITRRTRGARGPLPPQILSAAARPPASLPPSLPPRRSRPRRQHAGCCCFSFAVGDNCAQGLEGGRSRPAGAGSGQRGACVRARARGECK